MKIKIDTLKEGDNSLTFTASEAEDVLKDDYTITKTDDLTVGIQKSGNYLHVQGATPVEYETVCDRCAENFGTGTIVQIDYFFHIGDIPGGSSEDVEPVYPEKDGGDLIFDGYFRESFILSLPLRSLCGEDCKGLCGKCGANLNIKKCSCPQEKSADPRWETLTKLLKNNK